MKNGRKTKQSHLSENSYIRLESSRLIPLKKQVQFLGIPEKGVALLQNLIFLHEPSWLLHT